LLSSLFSSERKKGEAIELFWEEKGNVPSSKRPFSSGEGGKGALSTSSPSGKRGKKKKGGLCPAEHHALKASPRGERRAHDRDLLYDAFW